MSKIGYKEIPVSSNVQVSIQERNVTVKGPKGELAFELPETITITQADGKITFNRASEKNDVKALHGLFRSLVANAVHGVENGWEKRLQVVGTGYNVKMEGENLSFKLGLSHPVIFKKVTGVAYKVEGNNKVVVTGVDKQLVGQVAYEIKTLKMPDPYKGKGIRFENEVIRLKPGKKAKA